MTSKLHHQEEILPFHALTAENYEVLVLHFFCLPSFFDAMRERPSTAAAEGDFQAVAQYFESRRPPVQAGIKTAYKMTFLF